jgi:hypothetical protein
MGMCVVGRGLLYQHQQTRAAAAREGYREMDAARKNRRPGGGAVGGVLVVVTGPGGGVVSAGCGGCLVRCCGSFGCLLTLGAKSQARFACLDGPSPVASERPSVATLLPCKTRHRARKCLCVPQ